MRPAQLPIFMKDTFGGRAGEICRFIDEQPKMATYSEIAEGIERRFGVRPLPTLLSRYWHWRMRPSAGRISRLDRDWEVLAFVEDRLGRRTLGQICLECKMVFGRRGRHLSRASIATGNGCAGHGLKSYPDTDHQIP